jgi:hypothetical protein
VVAGYFAYKEYHITQNLTIQIKEQNWLYCPYMFNHSKKLFFSVMWN